MRRVRIILILWLLRWVSYGVIFTLAGREFVELVSYPVSLALFFIVFFVVFYGFCIPYLCLIPLALLLGVLGLTRLMDYINRHP